MNAAIIGGGAFGAMAAIRLAEAGESVTLFERLPKLMHGATFNANRVHLGFHYPRDDETAQQCLRGCRRFCDDFGDAILPGVQNYYFIAREGSLTSPAEFLGACRRNGLPHRTIDIDAFDPAIRNVALGVLTEEVMYDPAALRRLMAERLRQGGVTVRTGCEVADIHRVGGGGFALSVGGEEVRFDAVVNCSYAEMNRLTGRLGHDMTAVQYEYTAVPVVEPDWPAPKSISVLDGPFACLLPFGATGRHLLYHVRHSVIARSSEPLLPRNWLDPATSPFAAIDKERWYAVLLEHCCEFIPALRQVRLVGFVQGPRAVFADRALTDGRPSRVTQLEPGYVAVFSGKIDHCIWVADEVANALGCAPAPGAAQTRSRLVEADP